MPAKPCRRIALIAVPVMMLACTLARSSGTPLQPTTTMPGLPVDPAADTPPAASFPMLETITDPFENQRALLDGVCFDYLLGMHGETWVWTQPGDLASFYDRVDASGLCTRPVTRGAFNFDRRVLVGAVTAGVGCDAAHQVAEFVQDHSTRTQTLIVHYIVQPDCSYELVQPLLVAVPHPPGDYHLRMVVTVPQDAPVHGGR